MDMGNLNNILLEILATGVRFYAIKCFIDIFLSKDEYQCNAVREASKSEEKYLKIDIQTKKGIMLIHVKNSYSGRIIETGNKIQTSQKEVAIHGIGLENVKKIVKSNGGEIEIGYTENYFEVKILLYLSNIK